MQKDSIASPERTEIVTLNTLSADTLSTLDSQTRDLVERRGRVMGPAYRLSYEEPFQPVRAQGTKIFDVHGDEYLDAYNNVPSVGHNHPHVVDAVCRQLRTINTNTRYLQRDIIEYAENLVETHDPELDNVMFTCTGSEANDLALRIARTVTGGTGVIVSEYAYHGCTRDVASWSPSSGSGTVLGSDVRLVPPPDTLRLDRDELETHFLDHLQAQIDDLNRRGVRLAALMVDSMFSSDGIYPDPGVLSAAADLVHRAGGLVVSDEVQSGFGRTGAAMWGYQRSNIVPDLITMGKPMGNGMPIGGVVAKSALVDKFARDVAYFNTFGGENAPVAAAQAVLEVIRDEDLIANAKDKGDQLVLGMRDILSRNDFAFDVRGAGLYIGVEFVSDMDTKTPDRDTTLAFVNGLRRQKILTSTAGSYGNVIKVRPPLVLSQADTDRMLTEFETVARQLGRHSRTNGSQKHSSYPLPTSATGSSVPGIALGDDAVREELRGLIVEELRGLVGQSRG
ncbi:aspartate aminotransferase family protein [Arthrobacter sp. OAP107]|uniref:aspartate aminotransferase family protein n=1 Tax=Arthrobacter sp. OAP107 TaxID=3156445 RepID=UPI00339A1B77